jgi:hypothetical protein
MLVSARDIDDSIFWWCCCGRGCGPDLSITTTVDIATNATSMPAAEGDSGGSDSITEPQPVTTISHSEAPLPTEAPSSRAVSRTGHPFSLLLFLQACW